MVEMGILSTFELRLLMESNIWTANLSTECVRLPDAFDGRMDHTASVIFVRIYRNLTICGGVHFDQMVTDLVNGHISP
jgi:hypothetical protein